MGEYSYTSLRMDISWCVTVRKKEMRQSWKSTRQKRQWSEKSLRCIWKVVDTNTFCRSSIKKVIVPRRDILSRIKPILEKSDVVELRALMHLMIDRIEIDPKTRSVDTIKIKFNKELTDYLCIGEEGASKEASSFLLQKNIDEIMFELKVG